MPRSKSTSKRIVLIIDDHELIRQGMSDLVRQAFDGVEVMAAKTFDEALQLIATPGVFLAIADLFIPGLEHPRDLVKLRRAQPEVKVVVLSGSAARAHILAALEAGVHGYIIKNERSEKLIGHLTSILAGEIHVPPVLADLTADPTPSASPSAAGQPLAALTKRQRQVLELVAEGLSNKEIGQRLGVAEGTVKMHVGTILKVIDAKNRAHAAAIGKQYVDEATSR